MSHSGPPAPPVPGVDYGPPVLVRHPGSAGRNGPPLWLGLVVMLLLPIAFTVGAFVVIFSSMNFGSLMTPVGNPTSVTTQAGMTYVVASEELGRRPCYTKLGEGPRTPLEAVQPESFDTPNGTFFARGGFTADGVAITQVGCPRAGDRLVIFEMRTGGLALKTVLLFGLAGLSFIGGLLMVIFRRRAPRY